MSPNTKDIKNDGIELRNGRRCGVRKIGKKEFQKGIGKLMPELSEESLTITYLPESDKSQENMDAFYERIPKIQFDSNGNVANEVKKMFLPVLTFMGKLSDGLSNLNKLTLSGLTLCVCQFSILPERLAGLKIVDCCLAPMPYFGCRYLFHKHHPDSRHHLVWMLRSNEMKNLCKVHLKGCWDKNHDLYAHIFSFAEHCVKGINMGSRVLTLKVDVGSNDGDALRDKIVQDLNKRSFRHSIGEKIGSTRVSAEFLAGSKKLVLKFFDAVKDENVEDGVVEEAQQEDQGSMPTTGEQEDSDQDPLAKRSKVDERAEQELQEMLLEGARTDATEDNIDEPLVKKARIEEPEEEQDQEEPNVKRTKIEEPEVEEEPAGQKGFIDVLEEPQHETLTKSERLEDEEEQEQVEQELVAKIPRSEEPEEVEDEIQLSPRRVEKQESEKRELLAEFVSKKEFEEKEAAQGDEGFFDGEFIG